MPVDTILTIDQGTTNSKAILLNRQGQIMATGSAALDIHYPKPGWVEQSAEDIWASVLKAIQRALAQADNIHIIALGISNQRESVVMWDAETGSSTGPVITWQCRRTAVETESLKQRGHESFVLSRTGLPLDPLFPASKINWLLNHCSEKNICIGTVDSWLIWNLTNKQVFATDRSNASRTQLVDVRTGHWDKELCSLFNVRLEVLPSVKDSKHTFGYTRNVPGIADGIPVASAIGDSHAALFGHAAFNAGDTKATFGTGSSVMMITPEFTIPKNGMTTTIAWSIDNKTTYALEGNILVSASLFPWAASLLGLDGDVEQLMELAESVKNTQGVMMVPALVGLGAPHWSPDARGLISGLSFSTTPAHLAHAAALSMPLQVVDVVEAMSRQTAMDSNRLFVDGGPTRNRFLMQMLADLLAQPVSVSKDPELSALGAGLLAGLQVGFWSDLEEIATLERQRFTLNPVMSNSERLQLMSDWHTALAMCQHGTELAATDPDSAGRAT